MKRQLVSFLSYNTIRWFIFISHCERNESNLFPLIECRSSFFSGVRHELCDTWRSDALHYESWKITVCMITTLRLRSVKGETREATMRLSNIGREPARLPPRIVHEYANIQYIHSFRPPSRNSCTCSAKWEPDRRNSTGCFFRFPFPSFPSPLPSRSIWEYGRMHRGRIPRIRAASSRERTTPVGYELVSTTCCTVATIVYRL